MMGPQEHRILIWGKTAPEVSSKYIETVCTGGVFEDGTPVRLYPIPFRYLDGVQRFSKYQWIKAKISKSTSDPRPESYKVDPMSITPLESIPTDKNEWQERERCIFASRSWQYPSVESLKNAQKISGSSMAIVEPKVIHSVYEEIRTAEELKEYQNKRERLKRKLDQERNTVLFDDCMPPALKDLNLSVHKIKIHWSCYGSNCSGHRMQFLDWEVAELLRREGVNKTLMKVRDILDLRTYATKFFMGNILLHPASFIIAGIWCPKRVKVKQPTLF